jgi:hypothetical protein
MIHGWVRICRRPATVEVPQMSENQVIRIMCPNLVCQRILAVPSHARGKLVRCRSCTTNIRIPVMRDPVMPRNLGHQDESVSNTV